MQKQAPRRTDLIEPELSYEIVGSLFNVYNSLGYGYSEIYYQRAVAIALKDKGLKFKKEILLPVSFHNQFIGKQRCDFLIENKILLEIKKGNTFSRQNIEQVVNYLIASNLRLAILANITPSGIIFRRIINTK